MLIGMGTTFPSLFIFQKPLKWTLWKLNVSISWVSVTKYVVCWLMQGNADVQIKHPLHVFTVWLLCIRTKCNTNSVTVLHFICFKVNKKSCIQIIYIYMYALYILCNLSLMLITASYFSFIRIGAFFFNYGYWISVGECKYNICLKNVRCN